MAGELEMLPTMQDHPSPNLRNTAEGIRACSEDRIPLVLDFLDNMQNISESQRRLINKKKDTQLIKE